MDFGATAMIALYPMTGKQLKAGAFVAGTIGLAEELGRLVRETRAAHGDPVGAVVERLNARRLFAWQGRRRRAEDGGRMGEGRGADRREAARTPARRSFSRRRTSTWSRSGTARSCARCPDLIVVMDAENGGPITTEELRYGFRVVVIGAPCVPDWRTEEGLALVGPRYFGYDIDFVPVEERVPAIDLRRAPESDVARGRAARRRGSGRACHARIARAARPASAAGDRLVARRAPGTGGRGAAARAGARDAGRSRGALDAPHRVRGLGDGASGRVSRASSSRLSRASSGWASRSSRSSAPTAATSASSATWSRSTRAGRRSPATPISPATSR